MIIRTGIACLSSLDGKVPGEWHYFQPGPIGVACDRQGEVSVSDTDPRHNYWHIRKYPSSDALLATI